MHYLGGVGDWGPQFFLLLFQWIPNTFVTWKNVTNRGLLKFVLLGNALRSDQNSGLPKFALLVHALHSEQYPYYDNILYLVTMSYTPLPQGSFIFILQTPYALERGESSILTFMMIFRVKINVNMRWLMGCLTPGSNFGLLARLSTLLSLSPGEDKLL